MHVVHWNAFYFSCATSCDAVCGTRHHACDDACDAALIYFLLQLCLTIVYCLLKLQTLSCCPPIHLHYCLSSFLGVDVWTCCVYATTSSYCLNSDASCAKKQITTCTVKQEKVKAFK